MSTLNDAIKYLELSDWRLAHVIVQDDKSALGSWLHGIVHLLEGDLGNARYWYARAHRSFVSGVTAGEEIAAAKRVLTQASNG